MEKGMLIVKNLKETLKKHGLEMCGNVVQPYGRTIDYEGKDGTDRIQILNDRYVLSATQNLLYDLSVSGEVEKDPNGAK